MKFLDASHKNNNSFQAQILSEKSQLPVAMAVPSGEHLRLDT